MQLVFYLFSTPCMSHLLYLMFRCDFDVMENLKNLEELEGTKHSPCEAMKATAAYGSFNAAWKQ